MPERSARHARLGRGLEALISRPGGHIETLGRILSHRRPQPLAGVMALLDEPPHFVSLMDGVLCFLQDACGADLVSYYSAAGPLTGQFFYRLGEEVPFDSERLAGALESCRAEAGPSRMSGGRPRYPSQFPSRFGTTVEGLPPETTYVFTGINWRGVFLIQSDSSSERSNDPSPGTLCDLMGRLMRLVEERSS